VPSEKGQKEQPKVYLNWTLFRMEGDKCERNYSKEGGGKKEGTNKRKKSWLIAVKKRRSSRSRVRRNAEVEGDTKWYWTWGGRGTGGKQEKGETWGDPDIRQQSRRSGGF